MPRIRIDRCEVEVPPGATILAAASKLGMDIPALCFLEGYQPPTSCLVCMVKVRNENRLVPSCATEAVDGMEIDSETDEVYQVRKTALELLLSDHVGDCLAPCYFACPAHMDIPLMLRQITAEDLQQAIVTVKNDIALPAVLGRICPKPCEKGCRRKNADQPVAICELERYVADADLASEDPYLPECRPSTGKRVAIIGAGPTGLSAAYYLVREGHAATIFDDRPEPGGRLRSQIYRHQLPREVLDAEIAQILRLGPELRLNTPVGQRPSLADLRCQYDAVLVACGAIDVAAGTCHVPTTKDRINSWGLRPGGRGIQVRQRTYETNLEGVFAAGNAIRTKGLVVRSVADGHQAACAINQYLCGLPVTAAAKPFSVRMGRLAAEEIAQFVAGASQRPREPAGPVGILSLDRTSDAGPSTEPARLTYTLQQAIEQAGRCLHCDCRGLSGCKLKRYAAKYGADPNRYRAQRAPFQQYTQHSLLIYEPGKCINCGLCIQIASAAGEPLGLTFLGRGFEVRVGVPFNRSMEEALGKVAAGCVAACPTAALSFKKEPCDSKLPILPTR